MINPIDILEAKMLELINDANDCIRSGHQVMPRNKHVDNMIKKSEGIIQKSGESLALLGKAREDNATLKRYSS
jgi:hypothetical protein